jgi:UDP-N-acetylglucosamine--N-acetylmuramyl-(pentapeptide) pyrophosphoryl-undecaprenol N-acetylglucosamine transferase
MSPELAPAEAQKAAPRQEETASPGAPPLPAGARYLVTGGGTGGHVYPAVAIADEIKRRDPKARFLYVGVRGKSEAQIVPRRGYPLAFVSAEGWPGAARPVALLRFGLKLALGVLKGAYLLLTFRPEMVIGTGGYVSAPVMLAAILLRRLGLFRGKTFIHEQNTAPGKLNLLVGGKVDAVGVSFPETLKFFPKTGRLVGYPVRRELGVTGREEARAALGVPPGKKVVFVFGGSQGARTLNRALVEALPKLLEGGDLFLIHGTGTYRGAGYDAVKDTEARLKDAGLAPGAGEYLRRDFFHDIERCYAAADLVVCRGGAGTLTEICARGLPSLVVPKANLPGDHQVKNARALAQAGAARVLYERLSWGEGGLEASLPGESLAQAIRELLSRPEDLAAMGKASRAYWREDALGTISGALSDLARGAAPPREKAPEPPGPDLEAMGGAELVTYLERRARSAAAPLSAGDREYLCYRADDYLASPSWQVRNRGVKLVGLLSYKERLPLLVFLLKDKRPVGLFLRLLGGDYEQVGFIRRNVLEALIRLDELNPEVEEALRLGLSDGYFEARTQAALAALHFAPRLGPGAAAIEAALRGCFNDTDFEVSAAAARALGAISRDPAVLGELGRYLFHKNWKLRQGIVEATHALYQRGVVTREAARGLLEEILITSNGFQPRFPLKAKIAELGRALEEPARAKEERERR